MDRDTDQSNLSKVSSNMVTTGHMVTTGFYAFQTVYKTCTVTTCLVVFFLRCHFPHLPLNVMFFCFQFLYNY